MKIGPLFVGWLPIEESERIDFGLDAWVYGWEMLHVQWNDSGYAICARPRKVK